MIKIKLPIGGTLKKRFLGALLFLLSAALPCSVEAAGVTIITHGFEDSYPLWVTAMADDIPNGFHTRFPGLDTNFSTYKLTLTNIDGTFYYFHPPSRTNGSPPFTTASGEIIIELDWSCVSGISDILESYASTYDVADFVTEVLLDTNSFPELNGHPAIEFPIHLVGHSRGGSLMSQISYDLGANGIWTDQLTTLDPYPLNNDGNVDLPALVVDAPAEYTYSTVLFADNYWQELGDGAYFLDPDGEPVNGAYVRQLYTLSGGYFDTTDIGCDHSNVHLWYHGTIDLATPANDGIGGASITTEERDDWWVAYEQEGTNAGFKYSLIGGGNRMSTHEPVGQGFPAIVDGYNQWWDLGAGILNPNRTALPVNNGTWPNVIRFDITGTNIVTEGSVISTTLYYQYGGLSNLNAQIYLDQDFNPYNSNSIMVAQLQPPCTGSGNVYYYQNLGLATTHVSPGVYSIYAKITDGVHTRYLYTPELVQVIAVVQPPVLDIIRLNNAQVCIGINGATGQTIVLQCSADLRTWIPLVTNTLTANRWTFTNNMPHDSTVQFYQGVVQ